MEILGPGTGAVWTQGLDLEDRGPLDIATYHTYKIWDSWLQIRRFLKFMVTLGPQSRAIMNPRGLIWILQHTKYIGCGPYGFREEEFYKKKSIISLWKVLNPGAGSV